MGVHARTGSPASAFDAAFVHHLIQTRVLVLVFSTPLRLLLILIIQGPPGCSWQDLSALQVIASSRRANPSGAGLMSCRLPSRFPLHHSMQSSPLPDRSMLVVDRFCLHFVVRIRAVRRTSARSRPGKQ